MRCHPYLQNMVETIHSEESGSDKKFNKILLNTVGYSVSNSLRAFSVGLMPFLANANSSFAEVRPYEKAINKLASKLAVYADFSLLVLGGKLKQAEMLSARLGDVMSYLYAAMASIRYYEQKVASEDREQAKAYFHYATRWSLLQAEQALFKFLDNFPSKATKHAMKLLTVTYNEKMPKISDDLVRELAKQAQLDTQIKKQLTHLVKVTPGSGHEINEQAYEAKLNCLDLLAKVKKGLRSKAFKSGARFPDTLTNAFTANVITADELKKLLDYNTKRELAIRVDEFDFDMNLLSAEKKQQERKIA
jgi:acyl-CoA dehydrogenase